MTALLNAAQTAARLPYARLVEELRLLLADPSVDVPARSVLPLPGGGSLFVMPALDGRIALAKLITFTPGNAGSGRPAIQGDVIVFDVATGQRMLVLDGPTVTARRTAAVSLLAAQMLAPETSGPLLLVGAGAQGRAHLEAFAEGLPLRRVLVASRTRGSAEALVAHARYLGLDAEVTDDPDTALGRCPLVVTCTPAAGVVLDARPGRNTFIAAVGAFTPRMVELGTALCRHCADTGRVVLDTLDARHEAGDLLQAGLDVAAFPSLGELMANKSAGRAGPVLFKSCGWAGWDLAAARVACPA